MAKNKTNNYFCYFLITIIVLASWVGIECTIIRYPYALEPPRPGEIEELEKRGALQSRIEFAKTLGNHKIDDYLLKRAISNIKRSLLQSKGMSFDDVDNISPLPAPPLGWSGMPTKGDIKIFALLIDFNDYPHVNSQTDVHNKLFGNGDSSNFPYESLKNYYSRSSYGLLNFIEGATLGWYRYNGNRSQIEQTTTGRENLIKQALNYFNSQGHDFSQYDNDNDGYIDYFVVLWSGPKGDWASFWWGFLLSFSDQNYVLDGKKLRKYSWIYESVNGNPLDPGGIIHETGHALGIPDYYDYDSTVGPDGGVGRLDMMADIWGDHNSFSKWVLGWITPSLVSNGIQILTLNPSATSQDAVIIWPGIDEDDIFSEFFVVQNRYRTGNDVTYPNSGLLIWHVDASLNYNKTNYLYDNSFTEHKLLRLMEADGLEEIEGNMDANAGDYYTLGKILGACTAPSSKRYDGGDSYVEISDILMNGQQITATFDANNAEACSRGIVVNMLGNGTGGVASSGRICTNYPCSWRYSQGAMVTLTPVEDYGSSYGGWSGCDFVNGKQCFVTLNTDRTVTITFNYTSNFGRISGRVTDGSNGIPNVYVRIYREDNSYVTYSYTNSEGNYVTGDLAVTGDRTGIYKVRFDGEGVGHNSIYYNGKNSIGEADIVSVISPNITQNINATLTKLGPTISGYVRTSGGAGISGVLMSELPNSTTTDANGYYSNLVPVPSGWSGTVTPIKSGYKFSPPSRSYSNVALNQIGQNYIGTEVFQDVPPNYWAEDYINAIYNAHITTGCSQNPLKYCPEDNVTRGQMAAFIIRSIYGESFSYTTQPYFSDVPSNHTFFKYVQKMKDTGITAVTGTYDVEGTVTRGQMAAFIIRTLYGESFAYTQTPYFTDVPSTHGFFKYVQKMKDEGITAVTGTYDVEGTVTRAQMATFLSRAFLEME